MRLSFIVLGIRQSKISEEKGLMREEFQEISDIIMHIRKMGK
jgi:hypothetical protein